ncbi:1-phosphatidylinositol 4,5-bisphosphate phosphodiesterase beta-1 isoform X2, partial [Sigmodon hispidus]
LVYGINAQMLCLLSLMKYIMMLHGDADSAIVTPIILRTDPQGFFFYWTDQNKDKGLRIFYGCLCEIVDSLDPRIMVFLFKTRIQALICIWFNILPAAGWPVYVTKKPKKLSLQVTLLSAHNTKNLTRIFIGRNYRIAILIEWYSSFWIIGVGLCLG